jgi:hypothetical protein
MSDSYDDYEAKIQLAEYAWEQALEEKQESVKFCTYPKCQTTAGCAGVCARQNTTPQPRQWVGLTLNEAEDFYDKYTDRAELINAIDKFLEEKNHG